MKSAQKKFIILANFAKGVITILFVFLYFANFANAQNEFKVQRGTTTIPGGATQVVLTAPTHFEAVSNLNNAFVRITNSQHTGAGGTTSQVAPQATTTIRFNGTTQIIIQRVINTTQTTRVSWEIVEYIGPLGGNNEFIVRSQGEATISATSLFTTSTITGAQNINKLVPFITGVRDNRNSSANYASNLITASFPNLSTVRFDRGVQNNNIVVVSFAVVEFTGSNWTVQRIEHQYSQSGTIETENLNTPIHPFNSFLHVQKRNIGDLHALNAYGHQVWISSPTQVSFQLRSGAASPNQQISVAWVISNPFLRVIRYNGTITSTGTSPFTGTITFTPAVQDLSNSSLFWNNDCNGTGTQFVRPMVAVNLASTDTLTFWRYDGSSGVSNDYRFEVVQWPTQANSITVEGIIYTNLSKTSNIGSGKTIAISANGRPPVFAITDTNGRFSSSLTVNPGDTIIAYLDNDALKASYITVSDGINPLNGTNQLELVTGTLIASHQFGTSITNAHFAPATNIDPDGDHGFTYSDNSVSIDPLFDFIIENVKTFRPAGPFNCGTIRILGTFSPENNNITIRKNWINNGIFNHSNSTIIFADASFTSQIFGSNTFFNLRCTTPNKTIIFQEGTTQTIQNQFRIDGNSFSSRINLLSNGGEGTTWNLFINGSHDCRFVAIQGANVSGTAYLPLNPPGFLDLGDNTNCYASYLPLEMIFYDDFENSTVGSSPPDKESSAWTRTGANWLTETANIVNTRNLTIDGTKCLHSRGGSNGQAVGVWNNPSWGSYNNLIGEVWFYDDMQSPKRQHVLAFNANGTQYVGVYVDTNVTTTKYRYCRVGFGGNTYITSNIDRTLGWHKVTFIFNSGTIGLYLDDVFLVSYSGMSDFSSFSLGGHSSRTAIGNTPMWFDNVLVYRAQQQTAFRWFNDDSAENPTPRGTENQKIYANEATNLRLRIQIQSDQSLLWKDEKVALQYRIGNAGNNWVNLSPSAHWNYADGAGINGAQIANLLLTNSNVRQTFVEQIPSADIIETSQGQFAEWDFCIISTPNAIIGADYNFRLVVTNTDGSFKRTLTHYSIYPSLLLTSATTKTWLGVVSTSWSDPNNWSPTGVPNSTNDVLIPGTAIAQRNCSVNINGAICKSLTHENGRTLNLGTTNTSLTVLGSFITRGSVLHSNSATTLNINGGQIIIDGGTYSLSAAAPFNAPNANLLIMRNGRFNISAAANVTLSSITIEEGGTFNSSGTGAMQIQINSIEVKPNGIFTNTAASSVIRISESFTNNGSMSASTGGSYRFTGPNCSISASATSTRFGNLIIDNSCSINTTQPITILGNLIINPSATLSSNSSNIFLAGNFANTGTFIRGTSTITLNGTALQTVITNDSPLYRLICSNSSSGGINFLEGLTTAFLSCTTPNSLLTFTPGRTYNITELGGLNLQGSASNPIRLRSSDPGSQWIINPSGNSWTCAFLDVQDSVNIHPQTIYPLNSIDSGNNINWFTPDSDSDNLPDYWEFVNFNNLTQNASDDTDSDELNNFLEFTFNTNPNLNSSPNKIYVDCNSSYTGMDGASSRPFKYLDQALDAAPVNSMIILRQGEYRLSNYNLTKNLIISGQDPERTIITAPYPSGSSSNTGQFLNVSSAKFALLNLTLTNFREDQPIISYSIANSNGVVYFENLKFTNNNTSSKSLIAPLGTQNTTEVYLVNCLFYNNIAAYCAELKGTPARCIHNTITANNSGGILLSGTGNSMIINSIIRENSAAEITNNSTGSVLVSHSNIEGGYPGAINSYDSPETYIDPLRGIYRPAPGTPAINRGLQTFLYSDFAKIARPISSAVEVGAFEFNPDDPDGDNILTSVETNYGTNPLHPDSDFDGLSDYDELYTFDTNPLLADSDGDGVNDGSEPPIGMDPSKYDGILIVNLYNETFEDPDKYPPGRHISETIMGSDVTHRGNIYVENGDSYDPGNTCINFYGERPESRAILFVERNYLPHHWIGISFKSQRARLPTNINEALVISGAHFAVNENGYLCAYNPLLKDWQIFTGQQIPNNSWFRILVHRDHAGKVCNIYLDLTNDGIENGTLAFSNLPIYGPDLENNIRISVSSVGEFDLKLDTMLGYPFQPF